MSLSTYRLKDICLECHEPCCRHVKHMPYMGEKAQVLFRTFLLGAFALLGDEEGCSGFVSFDMEWIIPAEIEGCLAYTKDKVCAIYHERPVSCRNFPVINPEGEVHDFCPQGEQFSHIPFCSPAFVKRARKLSESLSEEYFRHGIKGLSEWILEERPANMPLLYNGLWVLFLVLAGADVTKAISSQKKLLTQLVTQGCHQVTVLIPGSDYCITGEIDGLLANLDYLALRIERETLIFKVLSRINSFLPE